MTLRDRANLLLGRVVDQRTGSGWRIPALDGLRGVAAMMVLVAHTRQQAVPDDSLLWAPIERGGLGGVVLFFALSGFLLYLPWLRSTTEKTPPPRLREYAIRRCLRIMPAYYFSVIVVAVVRVTFGHREPISFLPLALHFVFLQSLMNPLQTVYWTLQVEEFFYWVLPLLHRLVVRWSARWVFAISIAISATWTAFGLLLPATSQGVWLEETPFFLPAFVLGIVTAVSWSRSKKHGPLLLVIGIAIYIGLSPLALKLRNLDPSERSTPLVELLMAPAASAVVLGVARAGNRFLEHPAMRFLGAISFSLYLWHSFIIHALPLPASIAHAFVPRLLVTAAVSIPVATLSYLFIEKPFLRLRPIHKTT